MTEYGQIKLLIQTTIIVPAQSYYYINEMFKVTSNFLDRTVLNLSVSVHLPLELLSVSAKTACLKTALLKTENICP